MLVEKLNLCDENLSPNEVWEKMEFLKGLPEEKKEKCSQAFTEMANYLINFIDKLEIILFGMTRKMIQDNDIETIDTKKMINSILVTYDKLNTEITNFNNSDLDVEILQEAIKEYLS